MASLSSLILLITLPKLILSAYALTHWQDIEALKQFKNSVDPTSVTQSSCLHSWDFSVDPCDHPFTGEKFICGLRCDTTISGSTRVTELALDPEANYSGLLSHLSLNLPYLENLDLSYNAFSGSIPGSVSNLTRIRRLALSHNSFSGLIPGSIGSLSSLEELYVDNNYLEGSIPESLNNLGNLKRLEIQGNRLSGEFPRLDKFGSLYYLDASDNAFSGELPGALPNNLVELIIRNNRLQGNVPGSLSNNLMYLQVLDLSSNRLSGSVPAGLFTHPSLQQLVLAFNQFSSVQDPGIIRVLNSELIAFDVSNNDLRGLLPTFIGLMPRLSAVSFENNKLSGMIPTQYALKAVVPVQGLARFERLLLGGNYLFGPIPGPFMGMKDPGSVTVSLGDNCLYRCPVSFFFCQGGDQKSLVECKSFVPVIP